MKVLDIDKIPADLLECVWSQKGRCVGPRYGVVYALGAECGVLAGYRSSRAEWLGLMGRRQFPYLAAGKEYAETFG